MSQRKPSLVPKVTTPEEFKNPRKNSIIGGSFDEKEARRVITNSSNGGDNEILPTETNIESRVLMSSGEEPDDPPSFKKTNFIIMIQTVILFALVIALVAI